MAPTNLKTAVLMGRTGSRKSTIANMLVTDLNPPHKAEIGDGMRGTTVSCSKLEGRGWTVMDTVGFGEGLTGRVPDEEGREVVIKFLKEIQGEYSHIIFVLRKGRCDIVTSIIWRTFLEIFKGGEKNFVVLVAEAYKKYLDEQLAALKEVFKECEHFMYADFHL